MEAAAPLPFPARLDAGETEALSLAAQERADLLLLDERAARRVAASLGLAFIGTLGIIASAAQRGLLDPVPVFERLRGTSFVASETLYEAAMNLAGRQPDEP